METNITPNAALKLAIDKLGSASLLARHLGLSPSAVLQWDVVPPKRALKVEELTGVSRHLLRPDVYGSGPANTVSA